MPTLYVNDVIQYRPVYGAARIATVTSLGKDGFAGVLTANKAEQVVGRYDQILRILKRADPDVDHPTRITAISGGFAAWECACGHADSVQRRTDEGAMQAVHTQQEEHWAAVRPAD